MKKRNYVSILLACVFSCPCVMPSLSVAQTIAYAEETQADTILPLSIKPDGDYLANTLLVTFKYDYSQEQIESVLFPELADTVGKDRIKEYKLTNVMANDGTVRMTYTVRLNVNHADQYTTYEVASKLHNTGYFHIIETTASDKALPFTETTDGDYYATALVTMFKYDFSKDEIEQVIVPELTELIGTDKVGEFKYIFTDDTSKRNCYNIYLMLDPADKQAAYEIAERLYETGYFYNITMNYVDHPAETTEPPKTTDSPIITSVASGDINCDGKTTVSDAILLARILAEDTTVSVTKEGMRNADMNGSGTPDSDDLTLILKQIAGIKD